MNSPRQAGAGGRPRSTVAGLRRRRLGEPDLTAQSVAVTAPALSSASGPAAVAAATGGEAVLSYLIATVIMLLVGYCVSQYARRMVAAGSLYSYAAKGFGPRPAFLAGTGLIIGYSVLAMSAMLIAGEDLVQLLARSGVLPAPGTPAIAVMSALLALLAVGFGLRGIAVVARTSLAFEAAAIATVLMVLIAALAAGTTHIDPAHLVRLPTTSHGAVLGVVLALISFTGFESASALSVEARRPQVTVPRAMMRTVWLAGALYLLTSMVQTGNTGPSGRFAPHVEALTTMAGGLRYPWLAWAIEIGVTASAFACMCGSITALVRLLFSMGREGVLWPRLGSIARRGTPRIALVTAAAAVLVVPTGMLLAGISVDDAINELATLASFGFLLAYTVVSLSTPRFLHRIGELTMPTALAGPVAAVVMGTTFALYASPLLSDSQHYVTWVFLGLVAVGMGWYSLVSLRTPAAIDEVGVWDQPVAEDLYDPEHLVSGMR